jgi:hypothetical protein
VAPVVSSLPSRDQQQRTLPSIEYLALSPLIKKPAPPQKKTSTTSPSSFSSSARMRRRRRRHDAAPRPAHSSPPPARRKEKKLSPSSYSHLSRCGGGWAGGAPHGRSDASPGERRSSGLLPPPPGRPTAPPAGGATLPPASGAAAASSPSARAQPWAGDRDPLLLRLLISRISRFPSLCTSIHMWMKCAPVFDETLAASVVSCGPHTRGAASSRRSGFC